MKRQHLIAALAATTLLAACATAFNAGQALAEAPAVKQALIECVAEDPVAQAALAEPADFFTTGYEYIMKNDLRTQFPELAKRFPVYVAQIEPQWESIWVALDGRDCGNVVNKWKAESELAWEGFENLAEGSARYKRFCDFYTVSAPLAGLFKPELLLIAPASLPGCPAPIAKTL